MELREVQSSMSKIDLEQRDSDGETVGEYIQTLPYDIDDDGVGFWQLVPAGMFFGFEGDELSTFLRMCIVRLIEAGAVAVCHSPEGAEMYYIGQPQYGSTANEIADRVVQEWLDAGGGDPPPWEGVWFVTPQILATEKTWEFRDR